MTPQAPKTFAILAFAALLAGSAPAGAVLAPSPPEPFRPAGRIFFEKSVPDAQAAILRRDLGILESLRLDPSNTELRAVLGLSVLSPAALVAWLEARISTVVGEGYSYGVNRFVARTRHEYPNPGIFPVHEQVPAGGPPPKPGVTIMSNVGMAVYEQGKRAGQLLGLKLEGLDELLITSPRSGVIRVGPGLFNPARPINAAHPDSLANSLPRLATLFHESRHSDGNGHTLGFLHSICPPTHPMGGNAACDRNLNGPYTVGARILKAMTEACTTCSAAEREALRLRYLDAFSRIPSPARGQTLTHWDPTPEGDRR